MATSDDEAIPGIPTGVADLIPPDHPSVETSLNGRCPLDDPGTPVPPVSCTPLTPQQKVDVEEKRIEQTKIATQPSFGNLDKLSWFLKAIRTVVGAIALLVIVACLFAAFTSLVQLLATLAVLPTPLRYSGYFILAALTALAAMSLVRFALAMFRLRENRQFSLHDLRELKQRREMQELAKFNEDDARQFMRNWLNDYPLSTIEKTEHQLFLESCGLSREIVQELAATRQELLSKLNTSAWNNWAETYVRQYQSKLDEAAEKVIRDYARVVAAKTAISPYAFVDMLAVVYNSFAMLTALCQIYQLRAGLVSMLVLAGSAFSQAFLAGRMEDAPIEDWLRDAVDKVAATFGQVDMPFIGNVVGRIGAPVFQGWVNGRLVYSLGRIARGMLRPLKPE